MDLHRYLKNIRDRHGESMEGMAAHLGITKGALRDVETGRKPLPKKWPGKLAEVYSLSKSDLYAMQCSTEEKLLLDDIAWTERTCIPTETGFDEYQLVTDGYKVEAIINRSTAYGSLMVKDTERNSIIVNECRIREDEMAFMVIECLGRYNVTVPLVEKSKYEWYHMGLHSTCMTRNHDAELIKAEIDRWLFDSTYRVEAKVTAYRTAVAGADDYKEIISRTFYGSYEAARVWAERIMHLWETGKEVS